MNIAEKQDRIVRAFDLLGGGQERYRYILKLGQKLDPLPEEEKAEENLVRGCQSQVWLTADLEDGKVVFRADSDAAITKGLVALMVKIYSGEEPEGIRSTHPEHINRSGLQEHA